MPLDPRSMPGTSMPHMSQMAAPYSTGARPPSSAAGTPSLPIHGLEATGVQGKPNSLPEDSTLGPFGTFGSGMGIPGGTLGLGRHGLGFGSDFAAAPPVGEDTAAIESGNPGLLDSQFGGQRTGYDSERAPPPYMQGARGQSWNPDLKEDGVVKDADVQRLHAERNQLNERRQYSQKPPAPIVHVQEEDVNDTASRMRHLARQRIDQEGRGGGGAGGGGGGGGGIHSTSDTRDGLPAHGQARAGGGGPLAGMIGINGIEGIGVSDRLPPKISGSMDALRPPIGASGSLGMPPPAMQGGMLRMGAGVPAGSAGGGLSAPGRGGSSWAGGNTAGW